MFGETVRRARAASRLLRAVLTMGLALAVIGPAPASAQDGAIPPEVGDLVRDLFGDDFMQVTVAPDPTDPRGDAATYGGDPRPDEPDIVQAGLHEVRGQIDGDRLADVCGSGQSVSDPSSGRSADGRFVTVAGGSTDLATGKQAAIAQTDDEAVACPSDVGLLSAAQEFLLVYALLGAPIDPDRVFQFVFLWAEPGLPVYQGAPGDPNNDETDSFDVFRGADGTLQLGRTRYRNGNFSFSQTTAALAIINPQLLIVLIPRNQFLAACINIAAALITAGGGVDKAPLPDNPTASHSRAAPTPTTASTTPEPPTTTSGATPTTAAVTATTVAVPTTTSATATTAGPTGTAGPAPPSPTTQAAGGDGNGGGAGVAILIGGLIIAIVAGAVYFYRRRRSGKDCEEEERAYALAQARVAAAKTRRDAAEAAWLEANGDLGELERIAGVAPVEPRRVGYPDGDEGDARFEADRERYQQDLAAYNDAQSRLAEVRAAEQAARAERDGAVAEQNEAVADENTARIALDACLGRGRTRTRPPASPGAGAGTPGTDPGAPGPTPPPTGTPPPAAPDEKCSPENDIKVVEDASLPRATFSVPRGPIDVDLAPATVGWSRFVQDGGLDPEAFAGTGEDGLEDALRHVEDAGKQITIGASIPTADLTVSCGRVMQCKAGKWVDTGRVRKLTKSEPGASIAFRRRRMLSAALTAEYLLEVQAKVQELQRNLDAANAWSC